MYLWQADRSTEKQAISMDDDRPDITGLYDRVLATMWCNDFEKFLAKLGEMKDGCIEQTNDGGQRVFAETVASHQGADADQLSD
jgi:hypothetical protein